MTVPLALEDRRHIPPRRLLPAIAALLLCTAGMGCQGLRLPAIDPSGARVFLPPPSYTTINLCQGWDTTTPAWTSPAPAPFAGDPYTPNTAVPYSIYGPPQLPSPPASELPAAGTFSSLPGSLGPIQLSGSTAEDPRGGFPGRLQLNPARLVAPVGQEVLLRAGICGDDGFLVTGEPVEWSLAAGSVGSIVEIDQFDKTPWRQFWQRPPKKLSPTHAWGLTSFRSQTIPRGQSGSADDITLDAGQTWISVSSSLEGATHVTCVAPRLAGWETRRANSTIHWIDGQWSFPSPAMGNPQSGHTLCTRVLRATNDAPLAGWQVAYDVAGGAPATFADGSQSTTIATDAQGQACVTARPAAGETGVTIFRIRVIRTGQGTGDLTNIPVGEGTTSISWSPQAPTVNPGSILTPLPSGNRDAVPDLTQPPAAASQLRLDVRGPTTADVDAALTYQLQVGNPGSQTAQGVTLLARIPQNMRLLNSQPIAGVFGDQVRWDLGELGPGESREVQLQLEAERGGATEVCGHLRWSGGTAIEQCATTQVRMNALLVEVRGATSARVGETVRHEIVVTNLGSQRLDDVTLVDRYDDGLFHREGPSPLEWNTGSLEPNQTRSFPLTFEVRGAGRLCHDVRVSAADGSQAQTSFCLAAGSSTGAAPPPADTGTALELQIAAPTTLTVSRREVVQLRLANLGPTDLTGLRVTCRLDPQLEAVQATPGIQRDEDQLFWVLPRLAAGQRLVLELLVEALAASPSACVTAEVAAAEGASQNDRACLRLEPTGTNARTSPEFPEDAPRGEAPLLSLAIDRPPSGGADTEDPTAPTAPTAPIHRTEPQPVERPWVRQDAYHAGSAASGLSVVITSMGAVTAPAPGGEPETTALDDARREITYFVEICNRSAEMEEAVALTVETPQGTAFARSTNPPLIQPARRNSDGRTVEFLPLAALRPGESARFRVVVTQQQADLGRFRAKVVSRRLPEGQVFVERQ